jgi:hypothetical protein
LLFKELKIDLKITKHHKLVVVNLKNKKIASIRQEPELNSLNTNFIVNIFSSQSDYQEAKPSESKKLNLEQINAFLSENI